MSRPPILIKDLVKGNQGDQIHMTTRNREFKDWFEQLTEHETYCLYNGDPMVNDSTFNVCPNKLKLVFNGGTTVSKLRIPEIPPH
ncbi:hypothetical protein KIW84_041409 [Lathyrus oleraceus]|uniref:Uncharacterized protein n=1 Tax=Pisum sativum TaxID=3888 RepID=A0A9D4X8G0_PEA|nr:hypothetical protein KIW84_041409 [Pisum sativum]